MSVNKTYCTTHRIEIYPVDSVIHLSNNKACFFYRGILRQNTLLPHFSSSPRSIINKYVPVRLFWWAIDHKWRQNVIRTHEVQPSVSLIFLTHFDVICDLQRRHVVNNDVTYASVLRQIISKNQSKTRVIIQHILYILNGYLKLVWEA